VWSCLLILDPQLTLVLVTVGVCAHVEVHALVQASVGGCVQTTGTGEVGITVTQGGAAASGAGGSATAGVEVTNASRLSELEGRSVNVGGSETTVPAIF
jgi:hypothetical protein